MSELMVLDRPNQAVRGPVVVYARNVLDPSHRSTFRGEPGKSLRELQPSVKLPRICYLNGDLTDPDDWDWVPGPDDHVVFLTLPKGGQVSTAILGIILIIVGVLTIAWGGAYLIAAGAGLLITSLIPTPNVGALTDNQASQPSPTYSTQLAGNSARLGQAIPVLYGRHIIYPDFASQPYTEFDTNNDQYYMAYLCLGQMNKFTLESLMLDDTPLSHFVEVQTQLVGPDYPGSQTLVDTGVVNAVEVANNELKYGVYSGPFTACGQGLESTQIDIDITCPKGLYFAEDDGSMSEKTASWLAEARRVSDSGASIGGWILLGLESLVGDSNTPIRRTYKYTVPAGRYEVRVSRQEVEDDNARAGHQLTWFGLRSHVTVTSVGEPSATFLAVRMKATSQLSQASQRRIALIIRRWLPTWNPTDGWTDPVETRSIAWALADILKNTDYGGKVPDTRIDLQTLYELDLVWADRGDEFNAVFDKRITLWAALQMAARCGRARPIMRGSVFTFVRDSHQELPVAMFNMRNIRRGSFNIDYVMFSEDDSDGLEASYFSSDTWNTAYVRQPAPGVLIEDMVNPANATFFGITNEAQAQRETLYSLADSAYRRCVIGFDTAEEGYLPSYGDLINVSHDVASWGYSGDVEFWNPAARTMRVSESVTWTMGTHYCILTDEFGDVKGPFLVGPGDGVRSIKFLEDPEVGDFEIYTGTERERTRFSAGPATNYTKRCRIMSIDPNSDNQIRIKAVVEDERVHEADAGWLTGPILGTGRVARYTPDDIPLYDAASGAQHDAYGFYSTEDVTVGSTPDEGYTYGD